MNILEIGKSMVCLVVASEFSKTMMSLINDLLMTCQRTKVKLVRIPHGKKKKQNHSLIYPLSDMTRERCD